MTISTKARDVDRPSNDLVPLREFFEHILQERDDRYMAKFAAIETATAAALAAQEKATTSAFAAAEKAIGISQSHADSWRKDANEWRGAMDDREIKFASRNEMDSELKGIRVEIQALRESRVAAGARGQGSTAMWGYVVGGFSFLLLLLSLVGVILTLLSKASVP